jgi:putative transposase
VPQQPNKDAALAAEGMRAAPMKPQREHATNNAQTCMVTSSTWERRSLFHVDAWAKLLIDTLYRYRPSAYLLHEFVIMPDHFHALITPLTSLEKAVQFIKGGFSYRAKKDLGSHMEIWQKGFQDHRIRDASDYAVHVSYIHNNPVKERLCERSCEFPYSSAYTGFELDAVPQGLKPDSVWHSDGAAKAAPFQNKTSNQSEIRSPEAAPFQNETTSGAARLEGVPLQGKIANQDETSHQGIPLSNGVDPITPSLKDVPLPRKVPNGSEATLDTQSFERARLQARRKGAY